ncbi:hypothetical protein AC629_34375 [Bradyrhizobium sp. NAS80.1]|uniref:hypothetical protein n=1 Tax=Bradyrhizobium sp. NAS80.1 TaxID=1680159 RepID=UPI000959E988|nr:hypothetical protein [Bradyrhizobium sp. NAS80.1]OKO75125.1 hypothetical protein AC629_34375 [Bradyrhizobium sp. NAS80.1]
MMKSIFRGRNNPVVKLQSELEILRKRAAALAEKLATAETELTVATKARQLHLIEGNLEDDQAARALQDAVNIAASQVVGFEEALASVTGKVGEIEHKIDDERAAAERAAAAEKLSRELNEVERALKPLLDASRRLVSVLEPIHHHFEATQIAAFVANTSSQVEVAAALVLPELRAMVTAIAEGAVAIPSPKPAPVVPSEPPPPTQTVFMLRSSHHRDHEGRKRFAGQYEDALMPVATAQRALSKGVAVPTTDPRRAQLRGARGGDFTPNASDVVDLDAAAEPKVALQNVDPVLRAANFTQIDRSAEERTIEIAVPRV